jgi:phage terminase large subunit-like protein
MIKSAEKYIADVLSGKVAVSATTRLTFERHQRDLLVAPENGWLFEKKAAEYAFAFCDFVKHCPDKRTWVPFRPEPWEAAIIYILYGWKKKDGNRRFNYAYIEIPKKNGKTTFASFFANELLFWDKEEEAEVYCAATIEKQARICFDKAKRMIEKSPALATRAKVLTKNVSIASTGSKMEPIGRDSESIEGVNPHAAIFDEFHVFTWKNYEVFENISSATVNRLQPLVVIITTSGRDKNLPCFEYRNLCIEILKGIKKQDDTFAIIYTLDEGDDWKNPDVWKKANPNWGISVIPERFQAEFQGALNSSTKEVSFKTKNLNLWVDAPEVWIPDEKWMACSHGRNIEELNGKPCTAGLDISSHIDLTSLALYFPELNAIRWWFWLPEEKAKQKEDRVDYQRWAKEGYVTIVPGGIIEPDFLSHDILEILKQYDVTGFAYDPHMAHHGTIQSITKGGFPVARLDPYSQAHVNMSAPTKEYERLVMSGQFEHFNNPVLRWQMRNVVIYIDKNYNISPDKKRSTEKIDGVVAAIIALGEHLTITMGDDKEIYKDHSLRFL